MPTEKMKTQPLMLVPEESLSPGEWQAVSIPPTVTPDATVTIVVLMATPSIPKGRRSARLAIVDQHIRLENAHDLDGVLRTFGETARYDDESWGERYTGATEFASSISS